MSLNDDMSQDDGDRLRLVMDRLFDTLDKDSNGMLDFVEYVSLCVSFTLLQFPS